MEVTHIHKGDSHYPSQLVVCLGDHSPATLSCIGNVELLKSRPLAFFCSNKCPGNLIIKTYDFTQRLRDTSLPIISGFHSPVERECLSILLRGGNRIIICPARGVERMRLPQEYREPLGDGRLLVLSAFSDSIHRADKTLAAKRNSFVAALAEQVFVAYGEPGSKTESLCKDVIKRGKLLLTFKSNKDLLVLGAKPIEEHSVRDLVQIGCSASKS